MAGGSNAIGSAVLFLSANADGMVAGLNKAETKAKQFSANVGKSLSKASAPGGMLGKINGSGAVGKFGAMFGGAIGATGSATVAGAGLGGMLGGPVGAIAGGLAGLTIGSAKAGLNALMNLPETFERLKASATGANLGVLTGVTNSFDRLGATGEQLLTRVLVQFGPVFANAADFASRFLDQIGPGMEWAADAGAALLFTQTEIASAISEVVTQAAKWGAEWLGISDSTVSGSSVMFAAISKVGQGVGYVWDAFAVGGGVVTKIVGKVIEGFGDVTSSIGDAIAKMAELGNRLPRVIRPDWLNGAAESVRGWGDSIGGLGAKWAAAGQASIDSWGTSARTFSAYMSGVEKRFGETRARLESTPAASKGGGPMFAAAIERGSREAYSIEASYRYGGAGKTAADTAKKTAEEAEKTRLAVERLEKAIYDLGGKIEPF